VSTDQEQDVEPALEEPEQAEPAEDPVITALHQILATEPAVLLDSLIAALRLAKDVSQLPKEQFHVVIVPDVGEGHVVTVDSTEALVGVLREARQQGGQAFGFRGHLLLPSKGGHYLVTPWGRFPLFAEDHDTEIDPAGHLGPLPPIPKKAAPVPVSSVPEDNGDDEPMDEEDDEGVDDDDDDEGVDDDDD
jgi:hypothetical protein